VPIFWEIRRYVTPENSLYLISYGHRARVVPQVVGGVAAGGGRGGLAQNRRSYTVYLFIMCMLRGIVSPTTRSLDAVTCTDTTVLAHC
jgi:hypothetical protein